MRAFSALIDKEWRAARPIVFASMVLAVLFTLGVNHWAFHWQEPDLTGRWIVPGLTALFTAVIAADLVSAERGAGRDRAFATLPVRGRTLWAAKVAFLVAAVTTFASFAILLQLVGHAFLAQPQIALEVFPAAADGIPFIPVIIGVGGTVLFFSTLVPRGFAAAVAGMVVVAAAVWAPFQPDWTAYDLQPSKAILLTASGVLGTLLAIGSLNVFARGPIHSAGWVRRSCLALIIPVAVLGVAGTATAATLSSWMAMPLGETPIAAMVASPDGKLLAVTLARQGRRQRHVWIVPTDGGAAVAVDGHRVLFDTDAWQPDGTLRVWTHQVSVNGHHYQDPRPVLRQDVNPRTGIPTRSLTANKHVEETNRHAGPRKLIYGVRDWTDRGVWGQLLPDRTTREYRIVAKHLNLDVTVRSVAHARISARPGCLLFTPELGVLLHRDLRTGEDLLRIEGTDYISATTSGDGRLLHVFEQFPDGRKVVRILDADTGARVAGPFGAVKSGDDPRSGVRPYQLGPDVSDWVLLYDTAGGRGKLLNVRTKAERPWTWTSGGNGWPPPIACTVPGLGTAFSVDGRIEIRDDRGELVRTLLTD